MKSMDPKLSNDARVFKIRTLNDDVPWSDNTALRKILLRCRKFSCNYLKNIALELFNETRFFKIRPLYDPTKPFELDQFPVFSSIS